MLQEIAVRTPSRTFGFGGFREKPTPPFDLYRRYAYDFEHYATLNADIAAFVRQVNDTSLQGNWDNPEGGLDGLMQTLLCNDVIGWRPGTSHVIVMITDAVLHVAGEGVLGGAWQPYEHACRLVEETGGKWVYNSLEHDFPSIAGRMLGKYFVGILYRCGKVSSTTF